MKILKKDIHESLKNMNIEDKKILKRITARGIIIDKEDILLIYTKRYNDYSFPGGGVDSEESIIEGLKRELAEETGAKNVNILNEFGIFEEIRPTHIEGYDCMNQISYFYLCSADRELGKANPESYEISNGSKPIWVNIKKAINHNLEVIKNKDESMGYSVQRETYVLEKILSEYVLKLA